MERCEDFLQLVKIERNNKYLVSEYLVSVRLLTPPPEALEDDEHPWWYMTAR